MAKGITPQNTGKAESHSFDKSLEEDISGMHLSPNVWTHARNAVSNTEHGDLGELSNEQSNKFCAAAPYTIMGLIYITADRWAIFSTDEIDSEIGLFEEGLCKYTTIVNDKCLNFSKLHLITGVSKENHDCTWEIYFADSNNPDRALNIDNVPWKQTCTTDISGCITCVDTPDLDCDEIRLAPLITNPCFRVEKGPQSGELLNGSYFVVGAYVINEQRISDYSVPSNVQALFHHSGIAGSLEVIVESMDERFDEFELVLVQVRALKTIAKKIGIYSTRQSRISLDITDERYETIPLNLIPLRNGIVDNSDAIFQNGDYMLRCGPRDKFDFNYQPLANQISSQWVSVEYPADYYRKGGSKTNYLRDEVYPFFIRWVYDTGDKTPSFHIPGRFPRLFVVGLKNGTMEDAGYITGESLSGDTLLFQTLNTASLTSTPGTVLSDGGVVIAKGDMAYWQSSELYDDDTPAMWNATYVDPVTGINIGGTTNTNFDLCNRPIRHHKFPANVLAGTSSDVANHFNIGGSKIRIMGIEFSNIKPPVDNNGLPITNIVGYEILRGTREGNKSIIAKGIINNMRPYNIGGGTGRTGLYPNYPYNHKGADNFINSVPGVSPNHFTFHSPDTSFKDPFLSAKEVSTYCEFNGVVDGKFEYPDKHPKHQLITDTAFLVAMIAGVGYALIKKNGIYSTAHHSARNLHLGSTGQITLAGYTNGAGFWAAPGVAAGNGGVPILSSVVGAATVGVTTGLLGSLEGAKQAGADIGAAITSTGSIAKDAIITLANTTQAASSLPGIMGSYTTLTTEGGTDNQMPNVLTAFSTISLFGLAMSEGGDVILRLIRALSPYQQYALQYNSHCFYNIAVPNQIGNRRHAINEALYLDTDLQDLGTLWRINNLYRGRSVALEVAGAISQCLNPDDSQQLVQDHSKPTKVAFTSNASSHYVGLKQRLRNQYGQLDGIIQIPATTCMTPIAQTTTNVIFGGDTYIGRHTEKNTMFFFYDWLHGQPDAEEFNYKEHQMIPDPKYWMDTYRYDMNEFFSGIVSSLLSFNLSLLPLASDKYKLDCGGSSPLQLIKKECYMYLFNSGVRDFFVESEVNIDLRDHGDPPYERHYDPYGFSNIFALFNSAIIKSGNYFKYDYSLSVSRLYNAVISWGHIHRRDYDPTIAEDCYVYRPNRVIYSLRQNLENKKDYWKVFLPNNYQDFKSRVTAIKPINKNGALILFENESPVQFQGVDTLQTSLDTKLTIGDGGLFSQPLQNMLNADASYEYGSCQDRLSVVNTASGIFWMSQNQGKIFQIQNGVQEISAFNNKWWLATYLPYVLTQDPMFINQPFELTDNPVAGIGCQAIYDNQSQTVYFCKKDYALKTDLLDTVTYAGADDFLVNGILPIKLGDPLYFNKASWTISYDPKTKAWIGYHDWHPDLLMPAKNNFLSISQVGFYIDALGNTIQAPNGIWRHNDRCDSYCNYYGIDYPFEVEYATVTPQVVNTLRSVEYFMEVYKYDNNCYDRYHVLDFNFDEAIVYNSEQCSGLLKLNLSPKNNAPEIITYPRINPINIDILYSKVEQKYRFNQFWDITDDRGEFNIAAERMIFNTEMNGYIQNLNPNNLDYNKLQTQRKKIRHYKNTVLLRRTVCGNRNMLVSLSNNKNLMSPR